MLHIFINKKLSFHHGDLLNDLNRFVIYIIFTKIMMKYIWMGKGSLNLCTIQTNNKYFHLCRLEHKRKKG